MAADSAVLTEALRYRRELGLSVIPTDPETKKPGLKSWARSGGLRAEGAIRKMFARTDDAVIGFPTGCPLKEGGFLYVLDVDGRHGGYEALRALPELPETVTSKSRDGEHHWFRTQVPMPTVTRPDGLELKGAGAYVIVPPAPGRHWLRNPYEFEVADIPDFLLPDLQPTESEPHRLDFLVNEETGEVSILVELSAPLEAIRAAKPGERHTTVLREGRRAFLRGTPRQKVEQAALSTGLAPQEVQRLVDYISKPSKASNTSGGRARSAHNMSCNIKVTGRDLDVLGAIVAQFDTIMARTDCPFENVKSDIFSTRFLAEKVGLAHPPQVQRCLSSLQAAGLLWKSPLPKRLKEGQRPCNLYRPTYLGLAVSKQASC